MKAKTPKTVRILNTTDDVITQTLVMPFGYGARTLKFPAACVTEMLASRWELLMTDGPYAPIQAAVASGALVEL
jgi:hypothetical protein